MYIYKVKEELPASERPAHWKSSDPHTEGNGKTSVGERGVVVLTNVHDLPRKQYEWSEIRDATRRSTNGSTKGIPRGTERVVTNKNLLPSSTIFKNKKHKKNIKMKIPKKLF